MYHNHGKLKPFYIISDIMKASRKHLYVFIYRDSKHAFVRGGACFRSMTMIKETWICNYYEISDVKPDNPEEAISDVGINNVNHVNVGIKHSVLLSARV